MVGKVCIMRGGRVPSKNDDRRDLAEFELRLPLSMGRKMVGKVCILGGSRSLQGITLHLVPMLIATTTTSTICPLAICSVLGISETSKNTEREVCTIDPCIGRTSPKTRLQTSPILNWGTLHGHSNVSRDPSCTSVDHNPKSGTL